MSAERLQHFARTTGEGLWVATENAHMATLLSSKFPVDYHMASCHLMVAAGCIRSDVQRINAALLKTDPDHIDCTELHLLLVDLENHATQAARLQVDCLKAKNGINPSGGIERLRAEIQSLDESLGRTRDQLMAVTIREFSTERKAS